MRFTPRSKANHQRNGRLATNVRANINCILLTACDLQAPRVEGRRQQRQLPGAEVKHVSVWRQLTILSQRNLAILMRDRASLTLMLAIAPVLGLLDFFIWPRNVFDVKDDAQGSDDALRECAHCHYGW